LYYYKNIKEGAYGGGNQRSRDLAREAGFSLEYDLKERGLNRIPER
jgi:hypothetical protein